MTDDTAEIQNREKAPGNAAKSKVILGAAIAAVLVVVGLVVFDGNLLWQVETANNPTISMHHTSHPQPATGQLYTIKNTHGHNLYETKAENLNHALVQASLFKVALNGADLKGAKLSTLVLEKMSLNHADFRGCEFDDVHFLYCNLQGADFSGAKLNNCTFYKNNLSHASFSHVVMSHTERITTPYTGLNGATAEFADTNLTSANFSNAILTKDDFLQCTMPGADFTTAVIDGCHFGAVMAEGARFVGTSARDATFSQSVLKNADFTHADITGTNFIQSTGVNTKGATGKATERPK